MKAIVGRAALIAATSATLIATSALSADAASHPTCTHGVDLVVGVNYSITYTYSKSKSTFQWNGHGYDHIHAYWTAITYFTNPGPSPYWTYKNCGGS